MGLPSQICSVILRLVELLMACGVAAIVGEYEHHLSLAQAQVDSRLVYTLVVAGLSIAFAVILFLPFGYSFRGFPVDVVLFILWIVAFALLVNLTGSHGCDSFWYWNNWGYYWGDFYNIVPRASLTQDIVGRTACAKWEATLALSFIEAMCWFFGGLLGMYRCAQDSAQAKEQGDSLYVSDSKADRTWKLIVVDQALHRLTVSLPWRRQMWSDAHWWPDILH